MSRTSDAAIPAGLDTTALTACVMLLQTAVSGKYPPSHTSQEIRLIPKRRHLLIANLAGLTSKTRFVASNASRRSNSGAAASRNPCPPLLYIPRPHAQSSFQLLIEVPTQFRHSVTFACPIVGQCHLDLSNPTTPCRQFVGLASHHQVINTSGISTNNSIKTTPYVTIVQGAHDVACVLLHVA